MRSICPALVATLALAGTSFAATINVPGDHATIQGAIDASSNGDVIAIAAGTYYEHSLNPDGKAITIGSASGNLDVTIDAQQGGSVFFIWSGEEESTVIRDLVITGGSTSYHGGGIYCEYSNPIILNCMIMGNTSEDEGGGIYCDYYSKPTISHCIISDNSAKYGAGISCRNGSDPTIGNCTITGNSSIYGGGGIRCMFNSSPAILSCTISNNNSDSSSGGGIYCFSSSSPMILNSVIEGNTAGGGGGGMYFINCIPTLTLCTIKNNTSQYDGGGILCYDDGSGQVPTLALTSVCGNTPNQIYDSWDDFFGNTVNNECTFSTTGPCCVTSGCTSLYEAQCADLGGTWLGEGDSCEDCPASCTGDLDNNGIVNIDDVLGVIGAWGVCP
ncbi:MAG: right-handed parallel beta-helix repeat-containing protein [Phycisphaerales bacterium]|nr:right-handed parallel beta-helix repeat-containing protein [Phycisphaerales bacterium]